MKAAQMASWFGSLPVDEAETIKLEFAVAIDKAIRSKKVSRKAIAESLQTSPAWVTKVLRGDVNLTIESMAKLAQAVGCNLSIKIQPKLVFNESASTATVFHINKYTQQKIGGAFEIDMKNIHKESVFCNDSEYANAA
jgi:transcriptional regulator with XRE-family HTH domain